MSNSQDQDQTQLSIACLAGDIERVQYLCENGADVNYPDIDNRTPIFDCCDDSKRLKSIQYDPSEPSESYYFNIVNYLLDHGANINHIDKYGKTVLFPAYASGYFNIVKLLVYKGSNINHLDSKRQTILYSSNIVNYCKGVTKFVLDHGIDHTIRDISGRTAVESLFRFHNRVYSVAGSLSDCIKRMELEIPTKGVHIDDMNK